MYVKSRMTANPITVSSETSVADAYELLLKHKVRRLPVVDSGRVVGIVSLGDIAKNMPSKSGVGQTLNDISENIRSAR